jgi:hypothetical protein
MQGISLPLTTAYPQIKLARECQIVAPVAAGKLSEIEQLLTWTEGIMVLMHESPRTRRRFYAPMDIGLPVFV